MKLSQSNFNLRSPDSYLVCSYLIATVIRKVTGKKSRAVKNPTSKKIESSVQSTIKTGFNDFIDLA